MNNTVSRIKRLSKNIDNLEISIKLLKYTNGIGIHDVAIDTLTESRDQCLINYADLCSDGRHRNKDTNSDVNIKAMIKQGLNSANNKQL